MIYRIDPLEDPRWIEFVQWHAKSSVYHTRGWLDALRRTYGYDPVLFADSPPGNRLRNGLVFCQINSSITGRRLVSLPFSDHCDALADQWDDLQALFSFLGELANREQWKYIEFRTADRPNLSLDGINNLESSETYCWHRLGLRPYLEEIFRRFNKSCVQRKIRRAEREALTCEEGRSEALLVKFYHLLLKTRRRHGLPPQPLVWFRNLIDCLGESLVIRVASKNGQPIAGILTLTFKKTIVYKYGGSDAKFHHLGGMPFLFWQTIQEAKKQGLEEFDLGRSDPANAGLIAFKDHLGASRSMLTYYRYPAAAGLPINGWKLEVAKRVFAHMPDPVLTTAGKLFYKHIG